MNNERVEGIGTIHGGDYNDITVDGMGKLKGSVTADKVIVSGAFKSKGKLTAQELRIDGFARIYKNIKIKRVVVQGTLKLRHADVNADLVQSEGLLTSTGTVCADEIILQGTCSVKKLLGEKITIHNDLGTINRVIKKLKLLTYLYFGRRLSSEYSLVDQIECTTLYASGMKARLVRANHVELGEACVIDRLYCDGTMIIDPSCRIRKIYSKSELKKTNTGEKNNMANMTIKKILDLYKHETINVEEAELMLKSVLPSSSTNALREGTDAGIATPWEEDGKLRLVAFLGKKLMKRGEAGQNQLAFSYEGEALNVECHGSLTCSNIAGNASAGGSISCKNIGQDVTCGGNISCNDIGGDISAGGNVSKGCS